MALSLCLLQGVARSDIFAGRYFPAISLYKNASVGVYGLLFCFLDLFQVDQGLLFSLSVGMRFCHHGDLLYVVRPLTSAELRVSSGTGPALLVSLLVHL